MQDEAWNSHAETALAGRPDPFGALLRARFQLEALRRSGERP